jgi:hypothetical protein
MANRALDRADVQLLAAFWTFPGEHEFSKRIVSFGLGPIVFPANAVSKKKRP